MSAKKVILGLGMAGAAVGIGYAIWRYIKRRRENAEEEARQAEALEKAEARRAEESARATDHQAEPEPERSRPASKVGPSIKRDQRPSPSAPLEEPSDPRGSQRINWSHVDEDGTVTEPPAELLAQAQKLDPSDELTAARLAASEHHGGTFTELACIVDSELNRAERKGKSLFESLTFERTFGKQGKKRRASTRQDPKMRHLWAARAVLSGEARGISRGSERFFDPKAMDRMHARYQEWVDGGRQGKQPAIVSCDALGILEAWTFDYGRQGASRCPPDRSKRGRDTLAWVGPIPGVDPLRLMLMKPAKVDHDHAKHYQAAREVLRVGLASM